MSHLPVLPVLVPMVAAILLLLLPGLRSTPQRLLSLASVLALAVIAVLMLVVASDGAIRVYRLGNWSAPFGIVLVHDRLAALMIALTSAVTLPVLLAALSGADRQGRHFHVFLQLQIAGINGAFLTGDLFNLFVFFEILLLASYTLIAHGGGLERARAGLSYVILNLVGSALFLIALGLVYGALGTLNMADLPLVLPRVTTSDQALVRTAMALMVAVFLLKAAVLPLGFWLPHVYTATVIPVSVLFVIMTKVGIYALLRVATIGFPAAPFTADLLHPWLPWLALATIAFGSVGVLAAERLAVIVANLVVVSSGTLLLGVASGSAPAITAALYYLVHTTLVTAGLFLLAEALAQQRGTLADRLVGGARPANFMMLGGAYLVLGAAASGVPPLSGFLAKLMVMQSLKDQPAAPAVWATILISGFIVALVLARAASSLFWEPGEAATTSPSTGGRASMHPGLSVALMLVVASAALVMLTAAPISGYARATAEQLAGREHYSSAVLGREPPIVRERRP